jgi:hypothetical protein
LIVPYLRYSTSVFIEFNFQVPVLIGFAHSISTLLVLQILPVTLVVFMQPSKHPLYLLNMINTSLSCLTATAGTRFSQDT